MPRLHPDTYFLYSVLPGEPNVGIWLYGAQQEAADQPVVLQADLVEWTAPRDILAGGPTTLGVGPYHTIRRGNMVYASTDPAVTQEWFLIPANAPDTFLISLDSRPDFVWTAGAPQQPIVIRRFTGEPNQIFKFDPLDKD